MSSFASFKRQLGLGTRLHIQNHVRPEATRTTEITAVQVNAIATRAQKADGTLVEKSWIRWPKASGTRVSDDGSVLALLDANGAPWLEIEILA